MKTPKHQKDPFLDGLFYISLTILIVFFIPGALLYAAFLYYYEPSIRVCEEPSPSGVGSTIHVKATDIETSYYFFVREPGRNEGRPFRVGGWAYAGVEEVWSKDKSLVALREDGKFSHGYDFLTHKVIEDSDAKLKRMIASRGGILKPAPKSDKSVGDPGCEPHCPDDSCRDLGWWEAREYRKQL